ncbi:uncharacterized protein [Diabrotica undecimpunctata]|uniref:uncharacterized protein n=1 Tax=Diabrotica undecimpunctata TaxID=50387 RepID=UPI003B640217
MDSSVISYLKVNQIDYELKIRGIKSNRTLSEKKSILKKALQKATPIIDLTENPLIFEDESSQIETIFSEVENLISEFEGNPSDSVYKRTKAHLLHLSLRLQRLTPDPQKPVESNFKDEAISTCLLLEANLDDKIITTDSNPAYIPLTSQAPMPAINPIVHVNTPVNVGDWNIKFSGDPKHLFSVLEKIQNLAESRDIPDAILFRSAVEFFSGNAAKWFSSVKSKLTSWPQLVELLKFTFLPHGYEDELWDQIKSRKQRKNEPFVLYQADILNLIKRLPRQPSEKTIISYIRSNLLPEYSTMIATSTVDTVDQLSSLINTVEINAASVFKRDPPSISSVENQRDAQRNPPRHFQSRNNSSSNTFPTNRSSGKNYVPPLTSKPNSSTACWNCQGKGHSHRECRRPRKIFCYRCGKSQVTFPQCTNCNPPKN